MKSFLRRILPFVYSLKGSTILKTCSSTSRQEFGRQFEEIVVQSLRKLFVDVAACGGPKDRGIDFRGVWRLKSSSMRVIGQCKRYKKRLGPKHIRELEGSLTHEVKETLGIIVSESGYTKDAYEVFMGSVYPMALSTLSGYSDDILCWYSSKENHKGVDNSINAKDSDTTSDMHGKSTNTVMLWDIEGIHNHFNIVKQSHNKDIKEHNNHHFPKEDSDERLRNTMVLLENTKESDFPTRTFKHNFMRIGTSKNQSQKSGFSDATDDITHLENSDFTGTGIGTFTMFELNPVGQKLLPNVVVGVKYRSYNSKSPELFISEQN